VRDGALLLSSSAMATGGSSGPLATGTPPSMAVGLGEVPLVVGLAWQPSGGLDNGDSEEKAAACLSVDKMIAGGGGRSIGENTCCADGGLPNRFYLDLKLDSSILFGFLHGD
jgi:hypothetical protein